MLFRADWDRRSDRLDRDRALRSLRCERRLHPDRDAVAEGRSDGDNSSLFCGGVSGLSGGMGADLLDGRDRWDFVMTDFIDFDFVDLLDLFDLFDFRDFSDFKDFADFADFEYFERFGRGLGV